MTGMSRRAVCMLLACAPLLGTGGVWAQNYPNKPIRIVTTQTAGIGDIVARIVARGITGSLGQPVIVDNRPSAVIPGEIVSQALPDGYTVLVTGNIFWLGPLLQKLPYDPVLNFEPVSLMVKTPLVLVVHPSVAANSVKELIALAKARPGTLNYASPGAGSPNHLAAELFKSMAGINVVGVHYKGAAPAITDLIGGQVQMMFSNAALANPQMKAGKLRGLAATTAQPSALVPGLPTMASSGLPGFQAETTTGMFTPAKTPSAIIKRLNQEVVRILNKPEVKEELFNAGVEVEGDTPEKFAAAIKSEIARMGKVIKDAGIRVD